jgi:hypothetical protein
LLLLVEHACTLNRAPGRSFLCPCTQKLEEKLKEQQWRDTVNSHAGTLSTLQQFYETYAGIVPSICPSLHARNRLLIVAWRVDWCPDRGGW